MMNITDTYERLSKFGHSRYKYFALGEGIDEISVHMPAGGAYGRKRKYWAFSANYNKLKKAMENCPDVESFKIYDLGCSVLNTQANISFYYPVGVVENQEGYNERVKYELSSDRINEIVNDKFNVKIKLGK